MTEIHQVNAVPSFFPTAQEWSVGMNWLRKHPVVATASAAASTAASVLSYLRNSDSDDEQDDENMPHSVSWSDERGGSLTQVCCSEEQTNAVRKPAMKIKRTRSSLEHAKAQRTIHPIDRTAAPRTWPTTVEEHGDEASPQWGWYVAITPPQDQTVGAPYARSRS